MNEQKRAWLTLNEVREGLRTKPSWQRRALVVLFERQTPSEQELEHTGELNGRGFSKMDSEILTSFAKQVMARNWLSDSQYAVCAKRLPAYSGQVFDAHLQTLSEQDRNAAESASHAEQLAEARQKRLRRKAAEKMMPDPTPDLDHYFGAKVRPGSLQHISETLSRKADGWQEQGEYGCR